MPLRLKWSHNDVQPYLAIPPGTFRHCDFGHVLKTNYRLGDIESHAMEDKYYLFWLDVYLRPNAARTAMLPGQFEIVVSAFGKNVQKTSAIIKLDWKGIWCEDSDALYNNCIKIELE
jgi:desulfoferrodoxin (superoxide reductase-like protein)